MSLTPVPLTRSDAGSRTVIRTEPMFHRVLRADSEGVRRVLSDIRARFRDDVCDDTLGRLELVLAEVMNNVVEHGPGLTDPRAPLDRSTDTLNPGSAFRQVHVCIVRHARGLACAVTDDGVMVPEFCLMPRALPESDDNGLPEGGFGWFLIQDLTQALCYFREGKRNFLAFSVPFAAERDAPAADEGSDDDG